MHPLPNPHTAQPFHPEGWEGWGAALKTGALVPLSEVDPEATRDLFSVPVVASLRAWLAFAKAPRPARAVRDALIVLRLYASRRPCADAVPFVAVIPGNGSLRHPFLGLFGLDDSGQEIVTVVYQEE